MSRGAAAKHLRVELTEGELERLVCDIEQQMAEPDGYIDYNSFAAVVKSDRTDFMKDAGTQAGSKAFQHAVDKQVILGTLTTQTGRRLCAPATVH